MNSGIYEIEWRELLVKRLKTAQAVLKRDAAKEAKQRTEAKQLAAGYPDYDAAHEAYGWDEITEKQLLMIEAIFNDHQENHSLSALRRMTEIIGNIEGEIKMLKNDPDYRKEIVGDRVESRLAAAI